MCPIASTCLHRPAYTDLLTPTNQHRRFSFRAQGPVCYREVVTPAELAQADALPLHSRTPPEWARAVLADPIALLIDHAFLEKKAAANAMELLTRWPNDGTNGCVEGWVETMTSVARDETTHLAQVTRILTQRGGRLDRIHKNPYANSLRLLVRKGDPGEILDRLLVSALIEVRSCERFAVLASTGNDAELAAFYRGLFLSEFGHYKVFLALARKISRPEVVDVRWQEMLAAEARILAAQPAGPRIHSGPLT
jgi:tRNA-(ms[2]io[6]A)-hydroxylase